MSAVLLLCSTLAQAQLTGSVLYDLRDGTIITAGESPDGVIAFSGNYSHHGTTYGLNMKVDGEINVVVAGSTTIRFLGSQYSGLNMVGTAVDSGDLGEHETKVANDLADTYDFTYSGPATTLNFKLVAGTGNDLYLPTIEVIPSQSGPDATMAEKNIIYYYDFRDGSIIPTNTTGQSDISLGLVEVIVGPSNAYGYNGTQHGSILKGGNQIKLQVDGNAYIKVGGSIFSNGTISASSATGDFDVATQNSQTAANFDNGGNVTFLYVGDAGTITLDFTGTNYVPYIETVPVPFDISLSAYVQKSGTITLNGVDIMLTSGATAADNATITLSDGIVLKSLVDNGYIALDLGNEDPETLTPTVAGEIASAVITGNSMLVTYTDDTTEPNAFTIDLYDNSYLHGVRNYDFKDGSIIAAGESPDGLLTLAGNYSHHGTQYGLNMKVDGDINIEVDGSSTASFLGSQYSSLNMVGTAVTTGDLGEQNTQVTNDLSDTYEFVYSGPGTPATLNFKTTAGSGNDLYLPTIDVIPSQFGAAHTTAEKNIVYYFDFRDGSIIPTVTNGQSGISKGLVEIVVGSSNAYGYNGSQHGSVLKGGNQIILQVAGNAKIRIGGSIYSNGTISVSSATGAFDIASQASATTGNFGNDGSTVDFLYVGDAGTVTLDFTGTNYIPYIEVAPVPYDVSLTPWVQKTGTITVNDVEITVQSGADASSNPTVSVSEGTVISATIESASILIDLAGEALSTYTPTFTGDIANVEVNGDSLLITYADAASDPTSYILDVADNSLIVEAEPGKTYTYNFFDGSELPQISYTALRYTTFVSGDGILTINSNTDVPEQQFGYHDASHGGVFFPGNSFHVIVAGNATITFIVDTYGVATDAVFEITDENGLVLGEIAAQNIGGADGFPVNFSYTGDKGVVTATLLSTNFPTAEVYIHGMNVANDAIIDPSNGKTDVWDFAATELDTMLYNNKLTEGIINGWYDPSITVGSAGNVLPSSWSEGALSWLGGGNDRLRTTNTNLTRYDENISSAPAEYLARIYVNSAANVGRYMSLTLSEDDEVTIATKTDSGGEINFQYVPDPDAQTDVVPITSDFIELKFVAKEAGTYRIFDTQGKPSYYRILRKDADYIALTGAVDETQAPGIPADYAIVFTNAAGKSWSSNVAGGSYNVTLPAGYSYELSLAGANGYVISSGNSVDVDMSTTTHDISVERVELYSVSGSITGLGGEISNLTLVYTPDPAAGLIYVPNPIIDAGGATYTVELEPNVEYTISAEGVNDFFIPANTITIGNANMTADVDFSAKPVYNITIDAQGLSPDQLAAMSLTFTNLYEAGYVYDFASVTGISLRDGTYTVAYSGLDVYPVELTLTSNLTVAGADATKTLTFVPVTNWPFDDKVIANGDPAYKGLLFTGNISNEIAKGHLTAKGGATIQVPVNPGERVTVTYYYTADFSIEGGAAITTNTQSTSILERVEYDYQGAAAGYVTITVGASVSTTYITNINVGLPVPYKETLTVGVDKDYQIINEALAAARRMNRPNNERVTIEVDPGNYEEMLVVDIPNISLKNAAPSPGIGLLNQGVDIESNAVRVTSYYGHGYSYFSMGSDQKWHADILQVNKENGYLSYENKGAGTTNGSYWNATVVVTAAGFEAYDIIFENSFNQYISQKEMEDVVVEWPVGGKGLRPTGIGNTEVQDRSFVERAAAIAFTSGADTAILYKCRVVGRQDSFYGAGGSRVVVYKGSAMGAVDYIFGAMTAVFYKTDLAMNVSDDASDRSYITAAQQSSGRGFLMYECNVTTAIPGSESASMFRAKPGYFGRPWQATTSEVVFYNTTIETSDFTGVEGQSLILPAGWQNTLGGESQMMYEYGTTELSGANNGQFRASWSTVLNDPVLLDGTDITTFNFTKGGDGWDPLPGLIANDVVGVHHAIPETAVNVHAFRNQVFVSNVLSDTRVNVYGLNGVLMKSMEINADTNFNFADGFWIVTVQAADGQKAVKVYLH